MFRHGNLSPLLKEYFTYCTSGPIRFNELHYSPHNDSHLVNFSYELKAHYPRNQSEMELVREITTGIEKIALDNPSVKSALEAKDKQIQDLEEKLSNFHKFVNICVNQIQKTSEDITRPPKEILDDLREQVKNFNLK